MQTRKIGVLFITTAVPRSHVLEVVNALRHTRWLLECCDAVTAAAKLRGGGFQVVLCEADILNQRWSEFREAARELNPAPTLIAMDIPLRRARLTEAAREYTWDVLEVPAARGEIYRLIHEAWQHSERDACPRHFVAFA